MATNAEVISSILARHGVEHVFGLPGGEVVVLLDAIRRAGMRFVLVGHEASAAFMADVSGQITGRPGVCVATLGPGAMNLTTGIANAYLDRSPVLALTAQIGSALLESFPHQRVPLDRIFGAITKRSALLDGEGTDAVVEDALQLAQSDRPGPVHLAIPADVAAAPMRRDPPQAKREAGEPKSALGPDIVARIANAHRPLALIGLGTRPQDASVVRALLETTQWPWMTTPKAKGIAPEDHPRFLGVASGMAIDNNIVESLFCADLLVGIGFDPVECDKPWYLERPIVNFTRWVTHEGRYQPLEVVGDIGELLAGLRGQVRAQPWPEDMLHERRQVLRRAPAAVQGALSPLAALTALQDVLPTDTVLTCDVGSHKFLAGQFWRSTCPHTFFVSNGLSSMGYGLPAAVAAGLHFPTRGVVALIGDGGLLMMQHNLPLIAAMRLPLLTIVFTDGSLSLIRLGQTRRGLPAYGTDFTPPDFVGVARACGLRAERVTTLESLKRQAAQWVNARVPALLDVPIDLAAYADLL